VAVHSTVADAGRLVAAGVDSIGHRWSGLDEHAVRDMAGRGTAWTPTAGALVAMLDAPGITPRRRRGFAEGRARVAELLPLAVLLGVPVLAGTDVTGSIPREVALLAQMGLEPNDALAAASTWPRRFPGAPGHRRHRHLPPRPPRGPRPAGPRVAVVAGGIRLR
jgi:imidazolonepropionase-like amidohydrolase